MDFLNFFGLKEDPFNLTPDPAYYYPSSNHNEGLLLMDYSIDQREGFLLIIGDPGTGKTTLLKVFLEKWKSRAETAMILTPRLSPEECLISIADDLDISLENKNKNEIIKALSDFVTEKSLEDKRVIIIVDEAQNLPAETLEELRLLSNIETDKDKLIQIILLGQPELELKLQTESLRQLNQRILTRIHLTHFTREETQDYINYRLVKAGRENLYIYTKTGRLIHKLSKGNPRLINMIISRALMAAYLEESNIILPRHLYHATKSLNHSEIKMNRPYRSAPIAAGIVLMLIVAGTSAYYYMNKHNIQTVEGKGTGHEAEIIAAFPEMRNDAVFSYTAPVLKEQGEEETGEGIAGNAEDRPDKADFSETDVLPVSNDNRERAAGVKENEAVPLPDKNQIAGVSFISVKAHVANVRRDPSEDAVRVGQTYKDNQFIVLEEFVDSQNTRWYRVPFRGESGWISGWIVETVLMEEIVGDSPETAEAGALSDSGSYNRDLPERGSPDSGTGLTEITTYKTKEPSGSDLRPDKLLDHAE